jgi:putative ABC transport system permease protein
MDSLLQDLRFAVRSLRRSPGFTALVVGMMALGIGVNVMIWSVVQTFFFVRLPFAAQDRIVVAETVSKQSGQESFEMSAPDFLDLRERSRTMEGLTGYTESQVYLSIGSDPEPFNAVLVTQDLPVALAMPMALGRWFREEETRVGGNFTTVVLSHHIWRERFGGDPAVIGRVLRMNGRQREVIGVLPEGVRFPEASDFFLPMPLDPAEDGRGSHWMDVIGRLRPGATLEQARAEARTVGDALAAQYPETNRDESLTVMTYTERLVREIRPMLVLLMLAVGFVLAIACANVANLTLARASTRLRELGVRMALGAGRARVVRQMLTESVLLSVLGGVGGIVVAHWGLRLTLANIPEEFPYWMRFAVDGRALVYAAGVSALAGIIAGIAPAFQISGGDLITPLRESTAGGGEGPARRRLRDTLVVGEIALAVLMLVGSGLMVRTFLEQSKQATALTRDPVLTGQVTLPVAVYPSNQERVAFMREFRDALAALPGVTHAGAVSILHLGNSSWTSSLEREGVEGDRDGGPSVGYNIASPGYIESVGIRLLRGRDFRASDDSLAPRVALVNETAARRLWPGQEALGQRLRFGARDTLGWAEVVGVVSDVNQHSESSRRLGELLVPHAQRPVQTMTFAIRTEQPAAALLPEVRRLLRTRDPDLPFYRVRTLNEHVRHGLWESRIYAALLGTFSVLALVIAAVGIYGVMAYSVAQRTREIGIRMALGAARADVQRMVVAQAARLAALGLGIGLAAAYGLTRFMANLLFGVRPDDPPTYATVVAILALSAVVAAWVPALRATRVDPMVALRHE